MHWVKKLSHFSVIDVNSNLATEAFTKLSWLKLRYENDKIQNVGVKSNIETETFTKLAWLRMRDENDKMQYHEKHSDAYEIHKTSIQNPGSE